MRYCLFILVGGMYAKCSMVEDPQWWCFVSSRWRCSLCCFLLGDSCSSKYESHSQGWMTSKRWPQSIFKVGSDRLGELVLAYDRRYHWSILNIVWNSLNLSFLWLCSADLPGGRISSLWVGIYALGPCSTTRSAGQSYRADSWWRASNGSSEARKHSNRIGWFFNLAWG